ncbi:hypothetical protein ACVQ90_00555 [Staphylococcus aureus]
MAGRGTDIKLGEGVEALGGLAAIIHEHMENSRVSGNYVVVLVDKEIRDHLVYIFH